MGWNDSTSQVTSVTDTAGNTYILAVGPTRGTALSQSIYYASNIAAGNNTVKVTFNQAVPYPDIRILEYKGLSSVDVTAAQTGTGNSVTCGAATTTTANELIFGANTISTTTNRAGSGFTARIITSIDGDLVEDRTVTSAGSYAATCSINGNGKWVMQMVAFRK